MRYDFSYNLAILTEDIVNNILNQDDIDTDNSGVWCTLNDSPLLITWADLMDVRDSPNINKPLRDRIRIFLKERWKA